MGGGHIHVAVPHIEHVAGSRVHAQVFHQGAGAFRGGFGGHARPGTPDHLKQAAVKVAAHHVPGELIGLVGVDGHPDALGMQPGQQFRHTGIRRGLVEHVGAVPGIEFLQGGGEFFRRALGFRAEPLHQFGDAVAHKIAVSVHRIGGPAVGRTDEVGGIRQVVDGVQQGAVQIKQYGFIHFPIPSLSMVLPYYSGMRQKQQDGFGVFAQQCRK